MTLAMQIQEKTFQQERGKLLNFIRGRVNSMEDAEDILQDVFYQFTVAYDSIQSLDSITGWLYAVARNKIIDRYRKDASRPFQTGLDGGFAADEDAPLSLSEILPAFGSTPEDSFLKEMIWDAINEALGELPEEQREIFILNEIEEKGFREIAEERGESINTLLSRKRYAVMALRKRLQSLYDEILTD